MKNRGQNGEPEYGNTKQINRQKRKLFLAIPAHIKESADRQHHKTGDNPPQGDVVSKALDNGNQQPECQGIQQHTLIIELPPLHHQRIGRQEFITQTERCHTDGNIHHKKPRPVGHRQYSSRHGRACRRRDRYCQRIYVQSFGQFHARIYDPNPRRIHTGNVRCSKPLQ